MVEAALLTVGLVALAAAAIVVRRLTFIAARLVEVVEGLKTVRAKIRGRLYHPFARLIVRPGNGIRQPETVSEFRNPYLTIAIRSEEE
jgi:hypothetical protein